MVILLLHIFRQVMATIYFYNQDSAYGFLSNFYKSNFMDKDGYIYNCNEQYFMKKKQELFDEYNSVLASEIMVNKNPSTIKSLGRKVANFDEATWNLHKYNIMVEGLKMKFSQNDALKQQLLSTKNAILVEASPYDRIWGIGISVSQAISGVPWSGQNLLGKALMEVRGWLTI